MAWTKITRGEYECKACRYSTDLIDEEFAIIEPYLPAAKPLGRPRRTHLREVVNAILYVLRTGCHWNLLPKDFPPASTVYGYFRRWQMDGIWASMHHALVMCVREHLGREASPCAGIIDSQSVKTTESGGISGFDAAKKVKGRKRHIVVDTEGCSSPSLSMLGQYKIATAEPIRFRPGVRQRRCRAMLPRHP